MKFLIVDDHPVLRDGLAALLGQSSPDAVILQARSAHDGFVLAEQHRDINLVILDIIMPGSTGFAALSEFGRRWPDLPVIILSSSEDPDDVKQALAFGALGYVPKSANPHVLLSAVRLVLNGDLYVPPLIVDRSQSFQDPVRSTARSAVTLTTRQVQILTLMSQGQPNKTIAKALGLSEKTVKAHITAMFRTLNVANRTQAAAVAKAAGII